MSQEDLAKASGVSDFTISELEGGKRPNPRPSTLRKLAGALSVDVAALYGEEVPSPKVLRPRSLEELLQRAGLESRWLTLPSEEFNNWWLGVDWTEAVRRFWQIDAEYRVITAERTATKKGQSTVAPELQSEMDKIWYEAFIRHFGALAAAPGQGETKAGFRERQLHEALRQFKQVDIEDLADRPGEIVADAG